MDAESIVDHEGGSESKAGNSSTMDVATDADVEEIVAEKSRGDGKEDVEDESTLGAEAAQEGDVVPATASGSSASKSESDSGSDSESDEETSATSDEDDSDSDDEELENLLKAARVSAAKAPSRSTNPESGVLGGDGDVVSFDQERKQKEE
jgi:hypothetical protein